MDITSEKKIILIQNWFNSSKRHDEYMACLKKNYKNKHIDRIILLCNNQHDYLKKMADKVQCIDINHIPTFSEYLTLANILCPGEVCILANLDIYFDDSLSNVGKHLNEKTVLALSRWDILEDGTASFFNKYDSQDAWIFNTPTNTSNINADFKLGTAGCDNRIAHEFAKNYSVIGPSKDIKANHLHLSNYREWLIDGKEVFRLPPSDGYKFIEICERDYISFSMFTPKEKYIHRSWDAHASENRYWYNIPAIVAIYSKLYPNHAIKFYVSDNLTKHDKFYIIKDLYEKGFIKMEIIADEYSVCEPTLWRYRPIFNTTVDSVFVRDMDSIPSSSELAANNLFLNSQANITTIRSHTNHNTQHTMLLAGLCGFKPSRLNHTMTYEEFYKKYAAKKWGCDQEGLIDYICQQLKYPNSDFIDFAISSKPHSVVAPTNKNCVAVREPKLNPSEPFYINNKELITILDSITTWAGEPVDVRGDKLSAVLDACGEVGERIRDRVVKSGIRDFYGI